LIWVKTVIWDVDNLKNNSQEMRKLNRIKIAHTKEDLQRLTAEGYVPVEKKTAQSGADPEQKGGRAEQPAADSEQKDGKTEQPVADKGGKKK
ncbi:MAG: hypothetical protein OSJ71_17165, partial [Acetatifactor sp.]|nr:hypothetical protein [Acetatifactor sp.]